MVPETGFLKLTLEPAPLASDARSALIRKGNELMNLGQYEMAKRVFLTAGYGDGLVRLGEVYEGQGQPLEAFRMYWLAKYRKKIDPAIEVMARSIRRWLRDEREPREDPEPEAKG